MQLAESIPVATPELITYDEKGESCGYPAVSMTECQGTIDLHPSNFSHWITEMAHTLYQIHSIPVSTFEWTYFPYHDIKNLQTPAWFSYKKKWEKAKRRFILYRSKILLLNNLLFTVILWQRGTISGVVDWVNSCLGPREVDLGHCRLNLALLYGTETADHFLDAYREIAGASYSYDPYWD